MRSLDLMPPHSLTGAVGLGANFLDSGQNPVSINFDSPDFGAV